MRRSGNGVWFGMGRGYDKVWRWGDPRCPKLLWQEYTKHKHGAFLWWWWWWWCGVCACIVGGGKLAEETSRDITLLWELIRCGCGDVNSFESLSTLVHELISWLLARRLQYLAWTSAGMSSISPPKINLKEFCSTFKYISSKVMHLKLSSLNVD